MSAVQPSGELVGYSTEDLRGFLEAVDRRIVELHSAIATARATPQDRERDAAEARRRVASVWVTAQHEADLIRARAESEAREITNAARRLAGAATVIGPDRPLWNRPTGEGPATDPRHD